MKYFPIRNKLKTPVERFKLISYWAYINLKIVVYIFKKTLSENQTPITNSCIIEVTTSCNLG